MEIRKKTITLVLGLALVLALIYGLWERANRMALANAVEASGHRDFYNLLSSVEQSHVHLGKALASSSPRQQAVHLTEAWNKAAAAQLSLSQPPMPQMKPLNTSKFLAKTSDYAHYLAQKLARGQDLTPEEREQLGRLREEMKKLAGDLRQTESQVAQKGIRWSSFYGTQMPQPLKTIARISLPVQATPSPLEGLINADRRLQTMPSLNYDGPFSDHLERPQPLGLPPGTPSQEEAEAKALDFAQKASSVPFRREEVRRTEGIIPTYSFRLVDSRNPRKVNVDISRHGGVVVSLLNGRPVNPPALNEEMALEKALSFLEAQGFNNMQPTYSIRSGNSQVFTFAPREKGVILYPDQIKVKVALDNGEIVGWDATPYYMAHHHRDLLSPRITPEQAKAKIPSPLEVLGVQLALIPLPGGIEKLAYEVHTKMDDTHYLNYIDALTGEEEKVLQIIDVPGGRLTM